MDDNAEQQHSKIPDRTSIVAGGSSYAAGRLAKALTTAVTHQDATARDRAAERAGAGAPYWRASPKAV